MKNALLAVASAALVAFGLGAVPEAQARLVRFEVTATELVLNGAPFGDAGAYEKLKGVAHFAVDPGDPRNAQVFDIDKATLNGAGQVEFAADMYILKPVDMAAGNGGLFFEVNNRGDKDTFILMHDAAAGVNLNDPTAAQDFGNGFLMREGYVIAWVGWGADMRPGANRLAVDFPIAMENGAPITERILMEFIDRAEGKTVFTHPLSGGPAFRRYTAVSTDKAQAEAELRARPSDSPPAPGPEIPDGALVPADQWSFAKCPGGPPGTPSTTDICLAGGLQKDVVYDLRYRATGSPVMGLGYATTRDFLSFLRNAPADDLGSPNPVLGIGVVHCQGISSSGMYLRDFLYQGFNEDEQGRRVCDTAHIHVPGANKLFLNYRFAQPTIYSAQHSGRYVPDTNFPRAYAPAANPLTGEVDGILKRPTTDPKVWHVDSSTEYWQFRASLVDTDETGTLDLEPHPEVRRYLLSSTQHFSTKGARPFVGRCQQPSNPTHAGGIARALLVAFDQWVRDGAEPPSSRIPRIADGTLVPSDQMSTGFPGVPGVAYNGLFNGSGERDFGPRSGGNRGVIDNLLPATLSAHQVLVPKVDGIGNEIAGIRVPAVAAPLATLTGWNLQASRVAEGDLCALVGSRVPLYARESERLAAGDPRPSLEELYGSHDGYVRAVAMAANALRSERLLLTEDVDRIIAEAEASDVLRP
jgi:Alpha/beta hydrolase domain